MHESRNRRISEVLGERSFRNVLGHAVFFLLVLLPTVDAWQSGSETVRLGSGVTSGSESGFPYVRGFPRGRAGFGERTQSWWPDTSRLMWVFGRTALAVFGATLAMLILMPYRGCRRFAVLFGPPTGLMVTIAVGLWLAGRGEIYRFEPVVVAVVASLPTAGLWFWCCQWAFESRPSEPEIVEAEWVDRPPAKR